MPLRVIGAGVGRTGTTSLQLALEQLGFGKCYHLTEVAENPSHSQFWIDAVDGNAVDWDTLFDGYESAVDLPTYVFYEELMTHYPDAKVILTVRDADEWFESASSTIFRLPPRFTMRLFRAAAIFGSRLKTLVNIEPVARKVGYEYFFQNDLSREHAIHVFNQHNDAVRRNVTPERLLVYDVREGWQPLCEFLGVYVPETPFPHKNTREEFES